MRLPLALLLFATAASAHDLDVVYVQLNDADGGLVERLTLAAGTLGQLAPVDADGDGELTEADLAKRGDAVTAGVWEQMPLWAGGQPCRFASPQTAIRDTYLELWATFSCGPGELKQEFKWLRILPSNYRVVLGSQLDGERNRSSAGGNVQTLFIPRPQPPGAPTPIKGLNPLVFGLFLAALAVGLSQPRTAARLAVELSGTAGALAGWWLRGELARLTPWVSGLFALALLAALAPLVKGRARPWLSGGALLLVGLAGAGSQPFPPRFFLPVLVVPLGALSAEAAVAFSHGNQKGVEGLRQMTAVVGFAVAGWFAADLFLL